MKENLFWLVRHPRWKHGIFLAAFVLFPVIGWVPFLALWFLQLLHSHQTTDSNGMRWFYRVMLVLVGGLLVFNLYHWLRLLLELL